SGKANDPGGGRLGHGANRDADAGGGALLWQRYDAHLLLPHMPPCAARDLRAYDALSLRGGGRDCGLPALQGMPPGVRGVRGVRFTAEYEPTQRVREHKGWREGNVQVWQVRQVELRPAAPYNFALAAGYLRTSPSMVLERVGADGSYRRAVTLGGRDVLLRLRAAETIEEPRLNLEVVGEGLD